MATEPLRPKPLVLVVLDGWGIAPPSRANAITTARTQAWHHLIERYPVWSLQASGEAVGLTWGEMGNSEVGHLAIGTGRIIYQSLPRISRSIADGSFFTNPQLVAACREAKRRSGALHLIGLFSSGGVHSFHEHGYATLELAKKLGVEKVFVHVILDGRDTSYRSGQGFVVKLAENLQRLGVGRIATVTGRFWAMDRDNRWERTSAAYYAIVDGQGMATAEDPLKAIAASYAKNVNDEEFVPTVITDPSTSLGAGSGQPVATVQPGDSVICFNFRADRMRQFVQALTLPGFERVPNRRFVSDLTVVTMTEYAHDLPVRVAFPAEQVSHSLATVLGEAGVTQLHIAETEKYAHVTYFFNGALGDRSPGEEHVLIPSPKVTSYALEPAMSAPKITDRILQEISAQRFDIIIVNYANADMVAHTGDFAATVKAVEVLDDCLGQVVEATLAYGGVCCITADHGNAEKLFDTTTGHIDKEHSRVPVPFVLVGKPWAGKVAAPGFTADKLSELTPAGVLADVAPTILKILGLRRPEEMTGRSLI